MYNSIPWYLLDDSYEQDYFEIKINSFHDEYIPKPIRLFEMPDGLFYPIAMELISKKLFLEVIYNMTKKVKDNAHFLRINGKTKNEAYYECRGLKPILNGFHWTRIIENGFDLVSLKEWYNSNYFENE